MISLTPTGSPAETSAAYTLLAIIADPDSAKMRLEQLVAEKTLSLEAMDNARKAVAEANKTSAVANAKLAEATRISDAFNATQATRSKQLDDFSDSLGTKQQRLADLEASLSARETAIEKDMVAREKAVAARESDVGAREALIAKTGDEAEALKKDYEQKIAALQAAMAPEIAK